MATGLQVKNITQILKGGYPGEFKGVNGGYNNWTDVPLSGSVECEYYYSDSQLISNANCTTVYVTVQDSWNATVNSATNEITVRVVSTLKRVDRSRKVGNPGNLQYLMRAWDDRERHNQIFSAVQNCCCTGVALSTPVVLSERTFTLPAEVENGKGTIFYRSNVAGHDDDDNELYVDEFWMGSQFRNVLPDQPAKPQLQVASHTPVDCQTIDTAVTITQQSWGHYTTETAYARHKIGAGSWSSWSQVTTAQTGTYTITGIAPGTQVVVQSYSTGDNTTSDTQELTFTTPNRPQSPTLTFVSQNAELNQVTVGAVMSYTQPDGGSFGTVTIYSRHKVGDGDWTEWGQVASGATGNFHLVGLLPDRDVVVEIYSVCDGICSLNNPTVTFRTPQPPDPPVHSNFQQTDTGTGIAVSMPWTQPDSVRFSNGHTYWSWHIDNSAWSEWYTAADWTEGTDIIPEIPYGSTLCIRSYSVGDGLRGKRTETCITVSEETINDDPYEGDPFLVITVCNSLMYLVELICQEWFAIKDGDRIVYTNEEHKQHCDGDPDDPTLHSILSRIYRYFGAILCLICDGLNDDFNWHKQGPSGTILTANGDGSYASWLEPDDELTEDSTRPVLSGVIYDAIEELIHNTYHYAGDWEYLTLNPTTLADVIDPRAGDTALVKNGADGTNQNYTYTNGAWVAGELEDLDAFSLVHVDKESSWTYSGQTVDIPAGSAWYWYNNNWNRLDSTSGEIQQELEDLLNANMVLKQDENEEYSEFVIVKRRPNGTVPITTRPTNKTIYFVTEDI